jgi:tripartite ATP-independent transporter DctM subunit
MDPLLAGIISIGILLLLLVFGVHVAVALGTAGTLGAILIIGPKPALYLLALTAYKVPTTFAFIVIPMFILMGNYAMYSGVGESAYYMANRWLGHLPGGLAMATTLACGIFAAASGSSMATVATFTPLALPQMLDRKYSKALAGGALAASGTLGSLIPPSALMVIYGIFTEQPIGQLLIAGLIPGIMSVAVYVIMVFCLVKIKPDWAPMQSEKSSWKERFRSIPKGGSIFAIMALVLGGIYSGFCTPTEAGAFGAFGTFILMILKRKLSKQNLKNSLAGALHTTCMLFILIVGAMTLSRTLSLSGIQTTFVDYVLSLRLSPHLIVAGFVIMYIVLGMFLDPTPMMALTLPTIFPIVEGLGFSGIWFGVIVIKCIEIGLITPPLGLNVFVANTVSEGVLSIEDVFKGCLPFLFADLAALAILFIFPWISLWLPSMM